MGHRRDKGTDSGPGRSRHRKVTRRTARHDDFGPGCRIVPQEGHPYGPRDPTATPMADTALLGRMARQALTQSWSSRSSVLIIPSIQALPLSTA
jgi:hypothetical protein